MCCFNTDLAQNEKFYLLNLASFYLSNKIQNQQGFILNNLETKCFQYLGNSSLPHFSPSVFLNWTILQVCEKSTEYVVICINLWWLENIILQMWCSKYYIRQINYTHSPIHCREQTLLMWDMVILLPEEEVTDISEAPEGYLETVLMLSTLWDVPALCQIPGYVRYLK